MYTGKPFASLDNFDSLSARQSPNWSVDLSPYCSQSVLNFDRYLIWIGSNQENTFGPIISELIHKHIEPERRILWDSKKMGKHQSMVALFLTFLILGMLGGRPDTMELIKSAYEEWNAEVVFITSNLQGNQEMMEACMETGIPAFVRRFTLRLSV